MNDTGNLVDYLYEWHQPELVLTPSFLDVLDAVKTQEGNQINTTGLLIPKDLHEYLIKTPNSFPSGGMAMMLIRFGSTWSGHIMAGGDGASYDGSGDEDIEFRCTPGDIYSVSAQKGEVDRSVWSTLRLAVITNDKILDVGETDAKYGSVFLSGTC